MSLGKHQKSLINYLVCRENYVGYCELNMRDVIKRLEKRGLIEIIQKQQVTDTLIIKLLIPKIIHVNEIECNSLNSFRTRVEPYKSGYYYTKGRNRNSDGYYYDENMFYEDDKFTDYGPFTTINEAAFHYIKKFEL